MESSASRWMPTVLRLCITILIGAFSYFSWKLYIARRLFYRLRNRGAPMPPWNPILGHLTILPRLLMQLPKGAQQSTMFSRLSKEFPDSDNLFYIDLWPFSNPMIIVSTPNLSYQVCQERDLPRPASLRPFFEPITGGLGLFVMNGEEHRSSRALFNPGFGSNVILEHMTHIVEMGQVYVGKLREHAQNENMFSLDDMTCSYMMDVIGKVTLDARLDWQTSHNELAAALRSQINNHIRDEELNPFKRFSPIRPIREWHNGYKMDRYITTELEKRYQEWRDSSKIPKTKSVIDLALADYMHGKNAGKTLDPQFISWACAQIRLFLFVGHDSTAATIVYSLYLLSKHPEVMKRIQQEHDHIFGTDISDAPQLLRDHPQLINQLPYTTAVIKEALRLFPPAATFRGGLPGISLRDPKTNIQYPTENFGILILHDALHRHPEHWPRPNDFLPGRWLVGPEDPLYPNKWAWRPFEYGSRNCVGQTLVMLDVKVTLAMVVREFDVRDAYEEWDKLNGTKGIKTVNGERAYLVSKGSAHPADGFPCRVTLRKLE